MHTARCDECPDRHVLCAAQGLWERDSPLLQLPHFTREVAARCAEADVTGVFDLIEMEEEPRRELLQVRLCKHCRLTGALAALVPHAAANSR